LGGGLQPRGVECDDLHVFESTTGRGAAAGPARTDVLPSPLLELVLYQIHGVEEDQLTAYLAGGAEEIIKRKTFGPERWIRLVKEREEPDVFKLRNLRERLTREDA
jgi:hypothetical protein